MNKLSLNKWLAGALLVCVSVMVMQAFKISALEMAIAFKDKALVSMEMEKNGYEARLALFDAGSRVFARLDDKKLLALTLYGEARGESDEGIIAVATVILERVNHAQYGDSVPAVVLAKRQFSCFNHDDTQYGRMVAIARNYDLWLEHDQALAHCYEIASALIDGKIPGHSMIVENGVTYYHAVYISNVRWARDKKMVGTIGNHVFYAT
ncbi:MAG: cell wall hydrolase [Phycisphaerae bacterium]|nr:cell wall hydrolase [Phycisphaerae bacterium]